LPHRAHTIDRAGEPAENVDLMDGLIHERAAAFDGPAAFDGAAVVFGGTEPLDVGVALDEAAEAAGVDGLFEEDAGIVEAVLADDAEDDAGGARGFDHLARGGDVGRDGLLHLDVLCRTRRRSDGWRRKSGKVQTST
jgi:hypothetical protein